jgi:hypothetical protein
MYVQKFPVSTAYRVKGKARIGAGCTLYALWIEYVHVVPVESVQSHKDYRRTKNKASNV